MDAALLRPGRLETHILVDLPNAKERVEILTVASQEFALSKNVRIDKLAANTPGATAAQLATLCHEAAFLALAESCDALTISQNHFLGAMRCLTMVI